MNNCRKKLWSCFLKKIDLVPVLLLSNNLSFPPCNCTEICVYQTMIYLHPKPFQQKKDLEKFDWKQTRSRLEACLTPTRGRLEADYVEKCLKFDVVIK